MALTKLQREFIEHILLCEEEGSHLSDPRWADIHQLNPQAVKDWKKGKEFSRVLELERERRKEQSPGARRTYQWAMEQAVLNYDKARSEAERRQWWKEIVTLTKPEDDASDTIDYSTYSDDDLWALIIERGLESSASQYQAELERIQGES